MAVVAPAVTTTVAGTVAAAVLSLDNVTVRCAAVPAAGALNVTVPVELRIPPRTLVGLKFIDTTVGRGVTVRGALCAPPFNDAEIFAVLVVATA